MQCNDHQINNYVNHKRCSAWHTRTFGQHFPSDTLASPYTPGVYIFKNKVKPKKETIMPKGTRSDVSKEDFVNLKEKFQLLG